MKRILSCLALMLIILAGTACGSDTPPTVEILSPADDAHFAVNDEIAIIVSASDEDGITSVEVLLDGAPLHSEASPSGADTVFNLTVPWVPPDPCECNLMAIAYQPDGAASPPATISITVGAESAEEPADEPQPVSTPTTEFIPEEEPETGWVQGEIIVDNSALREKPGIYCTPLYSIRSGEIINLLEYSKDMFWVATDYDFDPTLEGEISWIWVESVKILGNEDDIPHGDELGCLGCGDGLCTPAIGEDCSTCTEDCGPCCGNGVCEPGYGEDCSTCETDCGPCCGNGVCEPGYGEDCFTCESDCGPCCGNGICEAGYGEDCDTCETDCGPCIICDCGDYVCDPACGEDPQTCPIDCAT